MGLRFLLCRKSDFFFVITHTRASLCVCSASRCSVGIPCPDHYSTHDAPRICVSHRQTDRESVCVSPDSSKYVTMAKGLFPLEKEKGLCKISWGVIWWRHLLAGASSQIACASSPGRDQRLSCLLPSMNLREKRRSHTRHNRCSFSASIPLTWTPFLSFFPLFCRSKSQAAAYRLQWSSRELPHWRHHYMAEPPSACIQSNISYYSVN
jgi:hypothetical protein